MVEPGTAAIATLAAIAGISGYGATKVNKTQDVVVEEKVQERIALTEQRLKSTQEALQAVEAAKAKQDAQLAAIRKELELLHSAKDSTEQPKQKNMFLSRFFPSATPQQTPVFAGPGDVTPEILPEPVEAIIQEPKKKNTVVSRFFPVVPPRLKPVFSGPKDVMPEIVSEPASIVSEPPTDTFPSEPVEITSSAAPPLESLPEQKRELPADLEERRALFTQRVSRKMAPAISLKDRLNEASKQAQQDVVPFANLASSSARVPRASERLPPMPPASTRRRQFAKVPTPYLNQGEAKRGGSQDMRKKKLRTRRGGKQKNVRRTRSR